MTEDKDELVKIEKLSGNHCERFGRVFASFGLRQQCPLNWFPNSLTGGQHLAVRSQLGFYQREVSQRTSPSKVQ